MKSLTIILLLFFGTFFCYSENIIEIKIDNFGRTRLFIEIDNLSNSKALYLVLPFKGPEKEYIQNDYSILIHDIALSQDYSIYHIVTNPVKRKIKFSLNINNPAKSLPDKRVILKLTRIDSILNSFDLNFKNELKIINNNIYKIKIPEFEETKISFDNLKKINNENYEISRTNFNTKQSAWISFPDPKAGYESLIEAIVGLFIGLVLLVLDWQIIKNRNIFRSIILIILSGSVLVVIFIFPFLLAAWVPKIFGVAGSIPLLLYSLGSGIYILIENKYGMQIKVRVYEKGTPISYVKIEVFSLINDEYRKVATRTKLSDTGTTDFYFRKRRKDNYEYEFVITLDGTKQKENVKLTQKDSKELNIHF